jgi:hypothetical protein
MTIINFQQIKTKQGIKGICVQCGKKKSRIITETQTINPFNKNQDGTVKNYHEVAKSVETNLAEKVRKYTENFICSSCKQYI